MPCLERNLIKAELMQRREEGCDVEAIAPRIEAARAADTSDEEYVTLYNELVSLPITEDFGYSEPSTLEEIRAERPDAQRKLDMDWDDDKLYDQLYGAWLGRAAGCALGKPVEGWPKQRIDKYLADSDALPLDDYIPYDERIIPKILKASTLGNITHMDRDDDLDYPILGLLALESQGASLTPRLMAHTWLNAMPFGLTYTAENAAYRNFTASVWPPESATRYNPFREWIGAQIRADVFGWAAPGWPEKAAELAFADASISHTKNGIYGEMWVAAMVAASFVTSDIEEIIAAGLGEIPANSRLAEAVQNTLAWCKEEDDWEVAFEKIRENYGHYHGVHTINNAALVVLGLWYGRDDYEKGIVYSVRAGWDTDCNGATVGSILGSRSGANDLPDKWIGVLNDKLVSAVQGENHNRISDLAKRTLAVAKKIAASPEPVARTKRATLSGPAAGSWLLESGWGEIRVDFSKGTVLFVNDELGPYDITSSSFDNPELRFSFSVDKGGWDYVLDFEGKSTGDTLEGVLFPGEVPITGRRIAEN